MNSFDEQFARIKLVTGQHTQSGLAEALGVSRSALAEAHRSREIPVQWLLILTLSKGANPEWILTGTGPRSVADLP